MFIAKHRVRHLAGIVVLAMCAFTSIAGAQEVEQGAAPNVVIILIDDMGYNDVGYHGSVISTPTIDRLASEGAELKEFYAQPTCSPTRASLMTGQSAVSLGILMPLAKITTKSLPLSEKLMPQYFKDAGYQTFLVGKWHLGHARREMLPNARGFDHYYGYVTGGVGHYDHVHGGGYDWQRNGKTVREEGYTTHLLTNEAVKLIKERDPSKPVFLYLSYAAPHLPNEAPEEAIAEYASIDNEHRRVHAAMVSEIDDGIAELVAALESEGELDNTLIWFMSDNGGLVPPTDTTSGLAGTTYRLKRWFGTPIPIKMFEFLRLNYDHAGSDNTPFRDGKSSVYEGGVRVPSFIYWKDGLSAGKVEGRITVQDVLPTLASAVDLPEQSFPNLAGADRWSVISTGANEPPPDYFIHGIFGEAYYRGDWKLIVPNDGDPELYDLSADPTEQNNIIGENAEVAAQLKAKIDNQPRGETVNPPIWRSVLDPDFFGGEEDREPWADVVKE